jgi:hypothetical protein
MFRASTTWLLVPRCGRRLTRSPRQRARGGLGLSEAESPRGLEVDDEFKLRRLLDR